MLAFRENIKMGQVRNIPMIDSVTKQRDRPIGNTLKKTFDSKGNLLIEIYPNGYFIENKYDNNGNLVKATSSGGIETLFSYEDGAIL